MTNGWLEFFDFARDPFRPARNPELVLQPESRHGLVDQLVQDVLAGAPVVTLRGDRGLGKSSLVRLVAARLRTYGLPLVEADATTTPMELQLQLGEAAGLPDCDAMTPDQLTQALRASPGPPTMVVVVDDADQLPVAGFRMLALLQQLFAFRAMALRLVLVGAPGRWPGLDQPDLEDLRQQCISHLALFPLREEECRAYLEQKFGQAGVRLNRVMSKAAVVAIGKVSGGVPAQLDALARDMLDAAFIRGRRRITLPMAWPAVSPDRSWTLPLTMLALRSPWLAAFGVLLLAGSAGLAFMWRNDLAAALDLRAAADTFAMALTGRDTDGEEPELPPLASLPAPAGQQPALPLDPALMARPSGRSLFALTEPPPVRTQAGPAPAEPKAVELVPASPSPAQAELNSSESAASTVPPSAAAAPSPVMERPSQPNPSSPSLAPIEAQRALPDATETRDTPATLPAPREESKELAASEMQALSMSPRLPRGGPGLMLVAGEADTLPMLYARVYRGVTPPPYSALLAANRGTIKPGSLLIFPEPPHGWATR